MFEVEGIFLDVSRVGRLVGHAYYQVFRQLMARDDVVVGEICLATLNTDEFIIMTMLFIS